MRLRLPGVAIVAAVLICACSKTVSAPDPTPRHYEVYASPSRFVRVSPYYYSLPFGSDLAHLGGADATYEFELGDIDTVKYIAICANTLEERYQRPDEDLYEEPAEVWFDAVLNLQTGRFFGSDADGRNLGHSVKTYDVYEVVDTATGLMGTEPSIKNLIGPPDGKYVALRVYDRSFIAIDSFLGEIVIDHLMINGDGPDIRVYARSAPVLSSSRPVGAARPFVSRAVVGDPDDSTE